MKINTSKVAPVAAQYNLSLELDEAELRILSRFLKYTKVIPEALADPVLMDHPWSYVDRMQLVNLMKQIKSAIYNVTGTY